MDIRALSRNLVVESIEERIRHEIFVVLKDLFDRLFPVIAILCTLALLASLAQTSAGTGSYGFFLFQTAGYVMVLVAASLRNRLPPIASFYIIQAVIFAIAVASLINRGLSGVGMIHLTFFCVFTGIYLGLRRGMMSLTASVAVVILAGIGVCSGIIAAKPDAQSYLIHPVNWLQHTACLIMYSVPLILSMKGLQQKMTQSQLDLKDKNELLGEEIRHRHAIEEQLRASEEKYRNIFEHATEGMFQISADGRLTSANPALAGMMGYASVEDLVTHVDRLNTTDYFLMVDWRHLANILKTRGSVAGAEVRLFRKDNSVIWVSVNCRIIRGQDGSIVQYEGSIENITDRKEAEQALIASEAKYRSFVESSLAGFFIVQDGRFRFVNKRCCEITGYSYDEIVHVTIAHEVVHPDDRDIVAESVARCDAEAGEVVPFDARIITRNGKIIVARIFISRTLYNEEQAISGTFIDITREHTLESQLRQAQKMEAIGQLAGGIAHDFNNILTAFNGYGSILQIKMPKDDPLRIYVDQLLSATEKASSLTQNLLTFSRQQPLTLAPVDINKNILGTEKLLRRFLTEDILFVMHFCPDEVIVLADAIQLDQILFNLVANARDAMPQGGELRLETDIVVLDHEFKYVHGFGKPGHYACISLSDTGTGMDRETLKKIFDPFFTTKERGRGTGLGLATVYGIVKQHNGYITVESDLQRGTSFRVYLPIVEAKIEEEAVSALDLRGGSETILVAEDNDDVRMFIRDIFDMSGYKTIEAIDGDDAVEKFRGPDAIDMVILDSVMPKKNGREVYDELIKMEPEIKVLFISGYTRDVVLDKGVGDADFHFLSKPLSPYALLEKVRKVLDD